MTAPEPMRGVSHRVIVVPSPDRRIFQEAVFILRDDYLGAEGISRRALLRQARACAEDYLARCFPAGETLHPLHCAAILSITAASVLLSLKTLEVI